MERQCIKLEDVTSWCQFHRIYKCHMIQLKIPASQKNFNKGVFIYAFK